MGDAFPADDAIARWVMNLSIALGDLRIVAKYATRAEQPVHERIYFVRIFASHLREVAKLVVLDYEQRAEIRAFVEGLPQDARDAREAVVERLNDTFDHRPDVIVWEDIKRVRDDTFHYASDGPSDDRLRSAMAAVADHEGAYSTDEDGWMRADYADLVVANRMHPFEEDEETLPITRELHERIIGVNGDLALFIHQAEVSYLRSVPDGTVQRAD